jgi:hypothetical protein
MNFSLYSQDFVQYVQPIMLIVLLLVVIISVWSYFIVSRRRCSIAQVERLLGTSVLVVAVGNQKELRELFLRDENVYASCYRSVHSEVLEKRSDLVRLIQSKRFQIVHLLHVFDQKNQQTRTDDEAIDMDEIIRECEVSGVRLLVFGNDIAPETYKPKYKAVDLNIIVILRRKGSAFDCFFKQLLKLMSEGDPLELAWVTVHPQVIHPDPDQFPDCICEVRKHLKALLP